MGGIKTTTYTYFCDLCGRQAPQRDLIQPGCNAFGLHTGSAAIPDVCTDCARSKSIRTLMEWMQNPPPYAERYKELHVRDGLAATSTLECG